MASPEGEKRYFEAGGEEHILAAARRSGLKLPSLCEVGWDIACAAKLLEGEVDNSDALRYYEEDREAGFILLCTARPCSDLRMLTHQTKAMRAHRDAHGLPAPRGT